MTKVSRPRGVPATEWEDLLLALEEYRDRDVEGAFTEANEMAQGIAERCVRLFLTDSGGE